MLLCDGFDDDEGRLTNLVKKRFIIEIDNLQEQQDYKVLNKAKIKKNFTEAVYTIKNEAKDQKIYGGTGIIFVLVENSSSKAGERTIICGNIGVSAAVLSANGKTIQLSRKHDLYNDEERKRVSSIIEGIEHIEINSLEQFDDGWPLICCNWFNEEILYFKQTRFLGNHHTEERYITSHPNCIPKIKGLILCEPEVGSYTGKLNFLVVASDSLWKDVNIAFVKKKLDEGLSIKKIATELDNKFKEFIAILKTRLRGKLLKKEINIFIEVFDFIKTKLNEGLSIEKIAAKVENMKKEKIIAFVKKDLNEGILLEKIVENLVAEFVITKPGYYKNTSIIIVNFNQQKI